MNFQSLLAVMFACFTFDVSLVVAVNADEQSVFASEVPIELWGDGEFTEGVAVRSDGAVFFSDIPRDPNSPGRIMMFDPATRTTSTFCYDSQKSNGLVFNSGDQLFACCGANGGLRSLCEITPAGDIRPIVSHFNGKRFNAPNDLTIHPDGSIYFSDPRYVGSESLELDGMWIFRFEPVTKTLSIACTEATKPNGVEASSDGKTMFVADTNNGSTGIPGQPPGEVGDMLLTSYSIKNDGTLSQRKVLVDFGNETGVDGLTLDRTGRIYAAVRADSRFGIGVYDASGKELDFLRTKVLPTNCCFGAGNDARTLYITAGGALLSIEVN